MLTLLQSVKASERLDSTMWLLFTHSKPLNVLIKDGEKAVEVISDLVRPESPSALYFSHLPESTRSSIVHTTPPLPFRGVQIIDKNADGSLFWREAECEEILDASLFPSEADEHTLLYSVAVEPFGENIPPVALSLYNAQQCNNPFLVDPSLQHIDLLTNQPFPAAMHSGLTTIAAQFNYHGYQWVSASNIGEPHCPFEPLPSQEPHVVLVEEEVRFAHVSQLPTHRQRVLASRLPRYMTGRIHNSHVVYHGQRWRSSNSLGLYQKLSDRDLPSSLLNDTSQNRALRRFWVTVDEEAEIEGPTVLRHLTVFKKVYHASQLSSIV